MFEMLMLLGFGWAAFSHWSGFPIGFRREIAGSARKSGSRSQRIKRV
jgi:hypothetical protein